MPALRGSAPLFLAVSACATLSPAEDLQNVEVLVSDRLGIKYTATTEDDPELERLLAAPLTAERAVELALRNNRNLRAELDNLGIARAELAGAKAPPNPELEGHIRVPASDASGGLQIEGELTINLIDLLRNVPKARLGEAELARAKLETADEILHTAAEAREHFYELLAAEQINALQGHITDADELARDFARRQLEAGTTNDLAVVEHEVAAREAKLELARAQLEAKAAKEALHRVLGLAGSPDRWKIAGELPPLPEREVELEGLEKIALEHRLDLAALEAEVDVAKRAVRVAEWETFPTVRAGVSVEHEPHGETFVGPALAVELPIFNWNRAEIAKREVAVRQAEQRYLARTTEIASELREHRDRLITARGTAEYYAQSLLPLHRRAVELAQRHYNHMSLGVFDLLRAKRAEVEAQKSAIEALRDYWIARTALEHAAGGKLAADRAPPKSPLLDGGPAPKIPEPEPEPAEDPHQHHHHGG